MKVKFCCDSGANIHSANKGEGMMKRDGKINASNRKHLIWAQCGNCHAWNKFRVGVSGTMYVVKPCNGHNCDCTLTVSLPRKLPAPVLDYVSELSVVTKLA